MIDLTESDSPYDYPLLIRHLLHTPLSGSPDQEIVSGDVMRYSYRTFRERIGRLASGLTSLGITSGHTVAVMDWDNHRYLECFFAVPMMGAVLHTVNIRLSPEQILYTINHADDDIILVHTDFVPILEQISDRFERPVKLVLLHDDPQPITLPAGYAAEYESMLGQANGEFDFQDFDENTRATTFYTTGTTGDPKGVAYTHRQLVLHSLGILAAFSTASGNNRFHKEDVYMPMTPMFHVHGWGMPYAATMLGVKQVYPGRYDPAKLLRLIEREGATCSHCVPTILQMLISAAEAKSVDLSRLKVVVGGSALPEGLEKTALDLGIEVFAAYGLSETCPVLTTADLSATNCERGSDEDLVRRRKPGKPVALVEVRVVDADMNDIPRDGESTGEIVTRSPWLTQTYTKNPEATLELWRGGYLHTGDVGYFDETGSLLITDRIKDVIKSGGEWISSLELESIVSRCEGVEDVAAIGIPDDRWGERPMLIIVRTAGFIPAITEAQVKEAIMGYVNNGKLSKWAIPERIEFVDRIDKTSVGKLDKKVLRARYAGEPGASQK
jgi:fatty-acyl-CoA synthase